MNIKEIVARLTKHSMSEGVWAEIKQLLAHIQDLEAENKRLRELADSAINEWEEQVFHTDIGDPKDQKKYRDALSKDK